MARVEERGTRIEERLNKMVFDLTRRDVIDVVLKTVQKAENYWRFLQRDLLAHGIHVSASSFIDVDYEEGDEERGEEGKYVVKWALKIFIPESLIQFIAMLRRQRKWKPPKEHPTVRQRFRRADEVAEEMLSSVEETNVGEEDG